MILALDPGVSTGWAVGSEIGGLLACGCGLPETWPLDCWGPVSWNAIVEEPVIRRNSNPKSIMTLQKRVGVYIGVLSARGIVLETVIPEKWKGQVPKPVHHRRGRAKMSEGEIRILDEALSQIKSEKKQLDLKDAVNLFLWRAGRLPSRGL